MNTHKHIAQKSATLDDVSARAGVSRMAASVVLNGSRSGTRVSEAKRQQILDIARELNYRPNLVARSLARRSTHIIGFYSGFNYLDARNPFVAEITAGLLEECGRWHRDLLLHAAFSDQDVKKLHDELLSGKIDGLVVWAPHDDPLVALLQDGTLPVVSIVETIASFPSIGVDDYAGAFNICELLHKRGHRSVLYLTQKTPTQSRGLRLKGIEDAAKHNGMDLRVEIDHTPDETFAAIDDSFSSKNRPTAIACWNDMVAYQVLSHCRRTGIAVPEQLAITGFDGIELPIDLGVRLTSVRAPWAQVASTAITILLDLLEGKEIPTETVLPVELIQGNTV